MSAENWEQAMLTLEPKRWRWWLSYMFGAGVGAAFGNYLLGHDLVAYVQFLACFGLGAAVPAFFMPLRNDKVVLGSDSITGPVDQFCWWWRRSTPATVPLDAVDLEASRIRPLHGTSYMHLRDGRSIIINHAFHPVADTRWLFNELRRLQSGNPQ